MTPWATPPAIEEEQVKGLARLETPDRARVEAERRLADYKQRIKGKP